MAGDPLWMIPDEIHDYLIEIFPNGGLILEFGSGDGTARLMEHFEVISIEHDPEWVEKVSSQCHLASIVANDISTNFGQSGWYDTDIVLNVIKPEIDIVLIDGPPGIIGRHGVLSILHALPQTVFFIIDDVHRPSEQDLLSRIATWYGIEPTIHHSIFDDGSERSWASITTLEK